MNDIGPDNGFDSAGGGVDRRDDGDEKNSPNVSVEIYRQRRKEVTPDHDHNGAAEIKPDADAEHAREKKNAAGHILCFGAEADSEKLINALHSVIVVRFNERERDDDAREHRADGELSVKVAARFESFRRRPEKCGGARLGGDDGSEHGPPWNRTRA